MKNVPGYDKPESYQRSSSGYIQTLKSYCRDIKQEVLHDKDLCRESLKKLSASQVIISQPSVSVSGSPDREAEDDPGNVIKIFVYNVNGNSNELKLTPGEVSVTEGSLEDIPLDKEVSAKIEQAVENLQKTRYRDGLVIKIPVFIININNILSNGNKNTVSLK